MVKIENKGQEFKLVLTSEEAKNLGLAAGKEFQIAKAQDGVFLLSETITDSAIDSIIFKLVRETPLQKRVVGQLEKTLHKRALERFQELVKNGEIVQFKLSKTKYKKPIYKTKYEFEFETKKGKFAEKDIELVEKTPEQIQQTPKIATQEIAPKQQPKEEPKPKIIPPIPPAPSSQEQIEKENPTINKEGYQIIKSQAEAMQLNNDLRSELKAGEIKGMKSFDGSYYIIRTGKLESTTEKIRTAFKKQKEQALQDLAKNSGTNTSLARVACEFMKEDGEILEKKKNLFKYI